MYADAETTDWTRMATTNNIQWSKAFDMMHKILFGLLTVVMGIIAFEGKTLISMSRDHEVRLTKMETSAYTIRQAVSDMDEIEKSILDLKTWFEKSYPPQWLQNDVMEIKGDCRELRAAIERNAEVVHTNNQITARNSLLIEQNAKAIATLLDTHRPVEN